MNKVNIRKNELLEELEKRGKLSVSQIIDLFSVSESTARRLCTDLERERRAIRIFGGIQKLPDTYREMFLGNAANPDMTKCYEEKQRIAKAAASLVESEDVLYVTNGTTTYLTLLHIIKRIDADEIKDLLVMTNSLLHAEVLVGRARIILTGGEYDPIHRNLFGYIGEQNIQSAHYNKSFIGTRGVDLHKSLLALDVDTANMDILVSKQSDCSYILADHSKFEKRFFVVHQRFLPTHTFITDNELSLQNKQRAEELGINMIIV